MSAASSNNMPARAPSLLSRQAVFSDPAVVVESGSTLLKADASVFHPMPNSTPQPAEQASDGYEAGFAAGQAQSDRVFRETLVMMEGVLAALKSDLTSMSGQIEESHKRTVRACLEAVLPDVAGKSLRLEIERIVQEAAKGSLGGTVNAKIHPENIALQDYFTGEAHSDISVTLDVTQSPNGLSFTWDGGGQDVDPVSVAAHCLSLIRDPETS